MNRMVESVFREPQRREGLLQQVVALQGDQAVKRLRCQRSEGIAVQQSDDIDDLRRREVVPVGQDLNPIIGRGRHDVFQGSSEQFGYQVVELTAFLFGHRLSVGQARLSRYGPSPSRRFRAAVL